MVEHPEILIPIKKGNRNISFGQVSKYDMIKVYSFVPTALYSPI